MQPEDLKTLLEIKVGNISTFNTFFKGYGPRLQATIYFLCNDKSLAEDIVQETFLRLWQNRAQLKESQSLKGYVRTISKNLFLDLKRKSKFETAYQQPIHEPISNDAGERLAFNELNGLVYSAISKFSPEQQQMYIGSRFKGKSYHEIALANNTTPKAVERHIAKISLHIKAYLKKHYFLFDLLMITQLLLNF